MFDPVRVPDAASQGRAAAHRFQGPARQGQLPRAVPPAGAEHRPEDPRRCCGWFPAPPSSRSSAARVTTAPMRVKREFRAASLQDRSRRCSQRVASRRGRLLRQRLPDGRPPDRERPRAAQARRARASAAAAAHRLRLIGCASLPMRQAHRRRSDVARAVRARAARLPRAASSSIGASGSSPSGRTAPGASRIAMTVQYQVQEMLRAERIFEPDGHRRRSSRPTTR